MYCFDFLKQFFLNDKWHHYCQIILVVELLNSFDKNLFLNKMHAASCKGLFNG